MDRLDEIVRLSDKVKLLEAEVTKRTAERDSWKDAWYRQRDATGIAWWQGYKNALAKALSERLSSKG